MHIFFYVCNRTSVTWRKRFRNRMSETLSRNVGMQLHVCISAKTIFSAVRNFESATFLKNCISAISIYVRSPQLFNELFAPQLHIPTIHCSRKGGKKIFFHISTRNTWYLGHTPEILATRFLRQHNLLQVRISITVMKVRNYNFEGS